MDSLLDTVPSEVVDEWLAFRRLEMDPLLRIIEVLKMGFASLLHSQGFEVDPSNLDPQAYIDAKEARKTPGFVEGPSSLRKEGALPGGAREVSPDEAVKMLASYVRLQDGNSNR